MSKLKIAPREKGNAETHQPFGINYRWTGADGAICTGRTVAFGKDRPHAERRFFNQNKHVEPEQTEGTEV